MTVINTNVGALMARTYAATSAQELKLPWNACHQVCALMVQLMMPLVWLLLIKCRASLGYQNGIRNSQDGISLVQTAESGMGEISNMILRMRELAVQMENGIYTSKDRDNAQLEVNALLQEIDKIAATHVSMM